MRENAARAFVPDEVVPDPVVRDLRASLRLIRAGKVQGWVDAMMATGPQTNDVELRLRWEERHRVNAEKHYAEIGA